MSSNSFLLWQKKMKFHAAAAPSFIHICLEHDHHLGSSAQSIRHTYKEYPNDTNKVCVNCKRIRKPNYDTHDTHHALFLQERNMIKMIKHREKTK